MIPAPVNTRVWLSWSTNMLITCCCIAVSEASVYRVLKAHDLITSPAFIVMKAASEFKDKATAINQLWQTNFTYLKILGWGWFYLSTILDDYSRYIIA